MNFSVLPPEVTSAQMYTGAGSEPLLAAAASWTGLGNELSSAAESFSSITSGVPWQGAAAAAMTAVAAQYAQWLTAAATHAGNTAAQAKATAGIFETARAAITHPAAIMANRTQLLRLVSSNLFGFNAPAIAAAEGQYESMWATNVAALSGYHGAASSVVAQLTPWQQALQRLAAPAAAVRNGSPQQQITAYNNGSMANLKSFVSGQLAGAQALTRSDLAAAGAAFGTGNLGAAAHDVTDAGLVNAGTALRVGTRIAGFGPQVVGGDLNILGGANPGTGVIVNPNSASPAAIQRGTGGLLGNLLANNNSDMDGILRQNSARLADTRALTHSDLAAASAALGKGDFGAAAHDVTNAALINAGTTLQVGGRTAFFAPLTAGEDLDIVGGGSSLVQTPVLRSFLAQAAPRGLLANLVDNNYEDVTGLLRQNTNQLAAAHGLTMSDLAAAGADLRTGNLGGFVHNVGDAASINAGTTLRIGSRVGDFGFEVAGEDLNILGGGDTGGAMTKQAFASAAFYNGSSGPLGNILDNNNSNIDGVLRQNSFQLADTRALTHSDLAAAGAALGKGNFGAAAHDVTNAALINAGTTLEVGGRTAFFAPLIAGQDLTIAGGGSSLLGGGIRLELLAAAAPGGHLQSLIDNNYFDSSVLLRQNSQQLAAAQALTRIDLSGVGGDLRSGDLGAVAHDVGDATLINAGTALRVGAHTGGFGFQVAGEDLNILGGGTGNGGPIAKANFASGPISHNAGVLGNVLDNNNSDIDGVLRQNTFQLSDTRAMTKIDLAAAGADLAKGDFGGVAHNVGDAALINAGTTLEVGGRTAFFAPQVAGEDLDIFGGGSSLLARQIANLAPVQELAKLSQGGLLEHIIDNNYADTSNLLSQNSYQLSATQALTRTDLAAAAADLGFGHSTGGGDTGGDTGPGPAATRGGLDGMRAAAREVANVGLINAGSAMDVAGRTAGLLPQAGGEDLDLFGGGSDRLWIQRPMAEFAELSPFAATPTGHVSVGTNNTTDLAALRQENQYQLSATHALARSDLAAARVDLGFGDRTDLAAAASHINVGAAAREVVNAGTISAGSGLDVAGRTVLFSPQTAGEDLDILGGGNSVIPGRLERK
jgi:PPE-repeat protein